MELIYTESFYETLAEIGDYIAKDSQYYAKAYTDKITIHTIKLKYSPYLGRIIPEQKNINYRELIYGRYRILYKVSKDKVYLIRVIHGKRKFSKRFLKF